MCFFGQLSDSKVNVNIRTGPGSEQSAIGSNWTMTHKAEIPKTYDSASAETMVRWEG